MAEDDDDKLFLYAGDDDESLESLSAVDIVINSEQDVWDLIRILSSEEPLSSINVRIADLDWARLSVLYDGKPFKQSLTADAMKGLVDFQNSLYQSVGLILKGQRKASVLTDEEKQAFRLIFEVGPGSSEVEAKGDDTFKEILARIVDKMESRHLLYCALLVIALYFTKGGLELCLNHHAEIKKTEQQGESERGLQALVHDMNETNKENMKLIKQLAERDSTVKEITTGSIEAHESIIRHSTSADKLIVNGKEITAKAASEVVSNPRRTGTMQIFEGVYAIEMVDPTNPQQYQIRLRNLSDGTIVQARLADAVAMQEFKLIIRDAEWNRSRILLKLRAKKIGTTFRNAEILHAQRLGPN